MSQRHSDVSRRNFLAGSAVAGSFTIVKPQSVRGSQANSKVAVGLIGSGGRGSYDASIVHADPRAAVVALCDPFDDQIERAKQRIKVTNPKVFKTHEKLLADPGIDAVIIASPPFLHPEHLEAAVNARKHIYCEKPMGVDIEGCRRVIQVARRADPKKVISVGFQQRYGPVYLEAYKRLQRGDLGEVVTARGFWIANDPFTRRPFSDPKEEKLRNWFCYREYSGDFIVEQDCHNFDDLHWFLGGLPVRCVGRGGTKVRTTMDLMDNLSIIFEWPNNILVNFEANQLTPRGFSRIGEEYTGTKGTIETSRGKMVHHKSAADHETIDSKRDITFDAIEQFLGRILSGDVENVAERSAYSTMIAILGRTAIYSGHEQTWKGVFGL